MSHLINLDRVQIEQYLYKKMLFKCFFYSIRYANERIELYCNPNRKGKDGRLTIKTLIE
jgi:hypothetical protein